MPNKVVSCGSGVNYRSFDAGVVRNNAKDIGDIFPIVVYDGVVVPISNAANSVLKNSK